VTFTTTGASIKVRSDQTQGGYTFASALSGANMRWTSSLTLKDKRSGQKVAKYDKSAGFKGMKGVQLNVLMPGMDDVVLDEVVATSVAASKMLDKDSEALEVMGEVLGAVAGT
jgi:uncharacterized lipoprotein YajG